MVEGLIGLGFFFLLLGFGVWIGAALGIAGIVSLFIFTDLPVGMVIGLNLFNWGNSFVLAAFPMFVWMGALLLHTKINTALYRGLAPWVSWLPGKLLHTNVLACTMFAAISGSSGATCAMVGTVAVPELKKLGYSRKLTLGSIAGSGTLGLLIPPSLSMITYCFVTRASVGQLFIAGIIPGLMIAGLFMGYIAVVAIIHPEVAPVSPKYSWKNRFRGLLDMAPTAVLIFWVLGSIYLGWATPSEAAAMGCSGALIIGLMSKTFSWKLITESLLEALYITGLFMFVVVGACCYATSVSYLGFAQAVAELMLGAPVPPVVIMSLIALLLIGLGCVTGTAQILLTMPILFPGVMALGFDPIWFGIFVIILTETGQITPPVGINLFILMGISGETLGPIARDSIPYLILLCVGLVIVYIFPDLALWLPNLMIRG